MQPEVLQRAHRIGDAKLLIVARQRRRRERRQRAFRAAIGIRDVEAVKWRRRRVELLLLRRLLSR